MPIKSDNKRTISFTDWVLEQQEILDNELLDREFDEDEINDLIDLDMEDRYPLYRGGTKWLYYQN